MNELKKYFLLFSLLLITLFLKSQPVNPWTPPEFFPAKGVLIEWDFNYNIWTLYSELIYECQEAADVILVVNNLSEENTIRDLLAADEVPMHNVYFVHVPTERMWVRDHGPISVMTDNGLTFIDLEALANSGVSEYLPTNLANAWGLDSYQLPYTFCGGNFLMNSYNTLFTTDRIYTNNPGYPQHVIDQDFETYMGITEIITFSAQHNDYWGHIDMQIKLLDDTTFVISSVDPGSGPNYDTLENNYQKLISLESPYGTPYRVEKILKADNWKTYANSLLLNHKLILPIYNHPRDTLAIQTYQELLPEHEIVGINANSIIHWGGAIHCITMQIFDDDVITALKSISLKENPLQIYPNPVVSGQDFNVVFSEDYGKASEIIIRNIAGQIVEKKNISNNDTPCILKWTHEPGAYIITIFYKDNTSFSQKIIAR